MRGKREKEGWLCTETVGIGEKSCDGGIFRLPRGDAGDMVSCRRARRRGGSGICGSGVVRGLPRLGGRFGLSAGGEKRLERLEVCYNICYSEVKA